MFVTTRRVTGSHSSLLDEVGATAVEYALMIALIAVVIMGAVQLLGDNLAAGFGQVSTAVSNAGGSNGANNNGQGAGWGDGVGGGAGHN